jgi:hypothetical protein
MGLGEKAILQGAREITPANLNRRQTRRQDTDKEQIWANK